MKVKLPILRLDSRDWTKFVCYEGQTVTPSVYDEHTIVWKLLGGHPLFLYSVASNKLDMVKALHESFVILKFSTDMYQVFAHLRKVKT